MVTLDANGVDYRELNRMIETASKTDNHIWVNNVLGQRYLGVRLRNSDLRITLTGVPGNDLAVFLAGPTLIIKGSVQDGAANTMDSGQVEINGSAGDALGYGMRGGRLFIRENAGCRAGIHMKEYMDKKPVIVIGGSAGDFLGEYMAGGIIILLNLNAEKDPVGFFCGTGMHGGKIYVRGDIPSQKLGREVIVSRPGKEDWEIIRREVEAFSKVFSLDSADKILSVPFVCLRPGDSRPYGKLYA